jgi:hypothetical protein
MLGLMNKVVPTNLGNLCFGIQVGLGGFWNSSGFGWVFELEHNGAIESIATFTSYANMAYIGITRGMPSGTTRRDAKHISWLVIGPTWTRGNCFSVESSWNHGNTSLCPTIGDTKGAQIWCYNGGKGLDNYP